MKPQKVVVVVMVQDTDTSPSQPVPMTCVIGCGDLQSPIKKISECNSLHPEINTAIRMLFPHYGN
jgi:hypothetical protein